MARLESARRCSPSGSRVYFPISTLRDSLEVSAVHSLAGFNLADELISRPPYSDPHHSASVASIVGGGQRMARPGAISCAHKAVLFLDEAGISFLRRRLYQRLRDGSVINRVPLSPPIPQASPA